jgi:HK97 family phage portal protein
MGALARAFERKSAGNVWERLVELTNSGARSKAGPSVNRDNIWKVSAAMACMREISQGLAQVPFKLMQDYEKDGLARKRVARDHAHYNLMAYRPNGWQTSFEFMETLGLHASLGNAYVFKNVYRGNVAELILLNPAQVSAKQDENWNVTYKVRGKSGAELEIASEHIWHVRGPSWDGFLGLDILHIAKDALGLAMAMEESAGSLHANGVRPTGVYSVEGKLDEDQHRKLTKWLKNEAGGAANYGAPLVLDRAAKWLTTAMTSVDAQHKEMRDQQIEEVCRFFGVLPSIIGYTGDKANTYASAEVMETAHKVRTLGRWYKRIQDSANVNLLTEVEWAGGYYWKFITNALMAANAKDRGEYYSRALGSGGGPAWMSQDEVRELDDMDPMGGDAAKLPPLNTQAAAPAPAPTP